MYSAAVQAKISELVIQLKNLDGSLQTVLMVMSIVEKFGELSGQEKEDAVVEMITKVLKLDIPSGMVRYFIAEAIKLTHGEYAINPVKISSTLMKCFGCVHKK